MASHAPAVSGARPQWRTFFTEFVKAPRKVASPLASSRLMVEQLLAPVDWSSIRTVVEYGPGTGSFTQVILDRLGSATRLIAVESETGLARHLSASIADPRLIVVNRCALDIGTIVQDLKTDRPDLIVSGLPFSSLPDTDRARLIALDAETGDVCTSFACWRRRGTSSPIRSAGRSNRISPRTSGPWCSATNGGTCRPAISTGARISPDDDAAPPTPCGNRGARARSIADIAEPARREFVA